MVLPIAANLDSLREHVYPAFLFLYWIGGSRFYNSALTLYYIVFPLVAALPFAVSYLEDMRGGYLRSVSLRAGRRHYFLAKYAAVFLSGGTAVTLPLLLNFYLSAMCLPAMKPEPTAAYTELIMTSSFGELFFENAWLYVGLLLAINFVFGGLFACMGLVAAHHTDYSFIVLVFPFLLYIFLSALAGLLGFPAWQLSNILNPAYPLDTKPALCTLGLLLFCVSAGSFLVKDIRKDIF
jgi:hypothetical protein